MRTLLVDADVLVHRAAVGNETAVQWDAETWTRHGNFEPAKAQVDGDVKALKEKLGANHIVMALSDYTNPWRKEVLSTYKANRKDNYKPLLWNPLRQYIGEVYEVFQRPTLEGDDCLGILATAPAFGEKWGQRVIVSIDKDMRTIPGWHFNPEKDTEVREVSLVDADRYHMGQALTGDRVDGYLGCPGVGKVRATRLLAGLTTYEEMWPVVVAAYEKVGLGEEEALAQARVARICRSCDYDFKEKRVKLWEPK